MKKNKVSVFVLLGILIIISVVGFLYYTGVINKYTLTIREKKWVDSNVSTVNSISVPNDINVFGTSGEGVFFDYIEYLKEGNLNINVNTGSYLNVPNSYGFKITDDFNSNGYLVYKDHYVLISNKGIDAVDNVGITNPLVLSSQIGKIAEYYGLSQETFRPVESYEKITESLNTGVSNYALVSLNEFKDDILENDYSIISHISDLNKYYYFIFGDNEILNNILKKKLDYWMDFKFQDSYNRNNYKLFIKTLNISSKDEDTLTNQNYRYGFNETSSYETFVNNSYGGITAEYLKSFADFSGVEFNYQRYNDSEELVNAVGNGSIDLYYNYYNTGTTFYDTGIRLPINYYVIANNKIDLSMSNLSGLKYQTVYVGENTYLYDAIKDIDGINIVTYKTTRDLKKILNDDAIIILDANVYEYYVHFISNDYSVRLKGTLNKKYYSFKYKNDTDTFYLLFDAYTKTLDPSDMLRIGIVSYNDVNFKRTAVTYIISCIVGLIVLCILFLSHLHNKNRKIKIDTHVRKEDRIKFIDMLTSLKNRNYYNEKLPVWNKNTIYPQACIVLDLNRVKELNDTLGYVEGDKQIRGVANILIRTQIDSSEIIRTDGNEFFIYLVGYNEKQVVNYMKKLVKEFKKLPYDYGVAMGFSMITDSTKLVEDAFNEASIKMRENKELNDEEDYQED